MIHSKAVNLTHSTARFNLSYWPQQNNIEFLGVIFPDDRLTPHSIEVRTNMTIHYPVNATQCIGGDIEGIVSLGASTGQQNSSNGLPETGVSPVTSKTWHWAHRWSNSLFIQLALQGDLWRKIGLTHSLTTVVLIANTGRFEIGSASSNLPIIYLNPRIFMPCEPSQSVTKSTWSYVLQWVSEYLFVCVFVYADSVLVCMCVRACLCVCVCLCLCWCV